MERMSEVYGNLRERLSNPFLFSYLLSWIFIKWKIFVALFWYDQSQISAQKYTSIYEFIEAHRGGWCDNLWWPLLTAIVYTFAIPMLKNLISMFQAWNHKWGDKKVFKISEDSPISFKKYIDLKTELADQTGKLRKLVDEQLIVKDELTTAKGNVVELNAKLNDQQNTISILQTAQDQLRDDRVIQGK
jgi:hypothetical protein